MEQSLYLHRDIYDILILYCGTIENAIDMILKEYDLGNIDIEDKPQCRPRDGAGRYNVIVNNENYLQLVDVYGIKSKRISLRRLLYWFVEYEVYDELGWEPIDDKPKILQQYDRKLEQTIKNLINFKIFLSKNYMDGIDVVSHATDLMIQLRR